MEMNKDFIYLLEEEMDDIEALKLENEKLKSELERMTEYEKMIEHRRQKGRENQRIFYFRHKEQCLEATKKWNQENYERRKEINREGARRFREKRKLQVISTC